MILSVDWCNIVITFLCHLNILKLGSRNFLMSLKVVNDYEAHYLFILFRRIFMSLSRLEAVKLEICNGHKVTMGQNLHLTKSVLVHRLDRLQLDNFCSGHLYYTSRLPTQVYFKLYN